MRLHVEQADRDAREEAAGLIEAYLRGSIPGGDLVENWPESPTDPALAAIADNLLIHIPGGDLRTEYAEAWRADVRDVLGRCVLFLRTDLPYNAGRVTPVTFVNYGCASICLMLGAVVILALPAPGWVAAILGGLGLVVAGRSLLSDKLTYRSEPAMVHCIARGCWPFEMEEDLDAIRDEPDAPAVDPGRPPVGERPRDV